MDQITKEDLGRRIRDLRARNKKSQEELGEFLGKSHAAISDIERGKTSLTVADLSKIAQFFNVDLETILSNPNVQANLPQFSHHRAELGLSKDDTEKLKKARQDFINEARKKASNSET